tara:strand:- start:5356 stop:5826 length:471 start_codon:yes stop_codon:yes gene_type:complete
MGIFDYKCALQQKNGKNCVLHGSSGQEHTYGEIFVVDDKFTKKFCVEYSGYGSADDSAGNTIYDRSYQFAFMNWGVQLSDKKGFFVCPNCAKDIIDEVDKFEDLATSKSKKELLEESLSDIEQHLNGLIEKRDKLNKIIRSIRAKKKRVVTALNKN